jgi:glycosyltransferase involved in cell wall biosynthesis
MLLIHNWLRTWQEQVDVYISLTEFARHKFIEGGLPPEKIVLKPNFVHPDPGGRDSDGQYALFVGRLSKEKGISTLLQAWHFLQDIPLKLIGDGPQMAAVQTSVHATRLRRIEVLGQRDRAEVMALMKGARCLIFPSEWYEGFGLAIAEAFACGLPVIASRLGAMAEIVEDGRTGLHFSPGNPEDLAAKVEWAFSHSRELLAMGRQARKEYEQKYTAERNYQLLMDIYSRAIQKL